MARDRPGGAYRKRLERFTDNPLVLITRRRRREGVVAEQTGAGAGFRGGVTGEGLTGAPDGGALGAVKHGR